VDWLGFIHPEDRARIEATVDLAMKPGTHYQARFRILRPDGQIRHLCSNSFKTHDPKGTLLRIVGVNWDVTEEMEREAELSRRRVLSHHSAQLAALGEMAGGIAHEINNPLFIIRAQAERLEAGAKKNSMPASVVAEAASRIQATVDRISTIVRGLKNMVRDGESDPWVEQEIGQLVSECLEPYAHRLKREGVELRLEVDPGVLVRCRPVQLSQILLNLLNNSFDALRNCARKEIFIQVRVEGPHALLVFVDSGSGVPPEIRDRVFSAFFTTKAPGVGTGLGLSISAALAASHGGELRMGDAIGEGARFELRLPLATKDGSESKPSV
jgi:C4-dicarboxylate-specific signal transduction histidine kinase